MNKFKIGNVVKCIKNINFMYGEKHIKGHCYTITQENESYFNVMNKDYIKIKN